MTVHRDPECERKVISPLKYLLIKLPWLDLVNFIDNTTASWNLTRNTGSRIYRARMHVSGSMEHIGSGANAKEALCNALASFLTHERKDIHEYIPATSPARTHEVAAVEVFNTAPWATAVKDTSR